MQWFLLFRTAERLQWAIAVNALIAWRIMAMTLPERQVPDCDPDLMFTDHELDFLRDHALEHGRWRGSAMRSVPWPVSAAVATAGMIRSRETRSCGTARPA